MTEVKVDEDVVTVEVPVGRVPYDIIRLPAYLTASFEQPDLYEVSVSPSPLSGSLIFLTSR